LPNLFFRVIKISSCSSVAKLSDQHLTHPPTATMRGEIVVTLIINIDVSGVSKSLKESSPVSRQCWAKLNRSRSIWIGRVRLDGTSVVCPDDLH
jgi:hypothetical protein